MAASILMIGNRGDLTFAHTLKRAAEYGVECDCIELGLFLAEGSIIFDTSSATATVSDNLISLFEYRSCYCRLADTSRFLAPAELQLAAAARLKALAIVLQLSPSLVINRPYLDGGNSSKLYQLGLLQKAGFRTPRSFCTNDYADAREFCEHLAWNVIYKSCSASRSIVQSLDKIRLEDLKHNCASPVLLQENIVGHDLRVHVIGGDLYGERIESSVVDYRYPGDTKNRFYACEVPPRVAEACLQFARYQGLPFVGFDFKFSDKAGVYYCLEANPSPGYNGYDDRADGRIAGSLLSLLRDGVW
jgi:glutathione synthase/RimK-type ligase-like ATP-grasp enzyme